MSVPDLNVERLQRLLPKAAKILAEIDEEEWSKRCLSAVEEARAGSLAFVPTLWDFFAPTCEWDDLTAGFGEESTRLGNDLFAALDALAQQHGLHPR